MKGCFSASAAGIVLLGVIGCGSSNSSSGGGSGSMTDAGAALERENATPADSGGAAVTQSAPAAAASQPAAAPSQPAAAAPSLPAAPVAPTAVAVDPSLASKRGFDLEDWSNEAAYVIAKTDAATLAELMGKVWTAKVVKNVLGKTADENNAQAIVYQLAGHSWSIFACPASQTEVFLSALSTTADVIVFSHSDFNAWASIRLFRGGEEVEAVHWGPAGDGMGEDADTSKWQTAGTVTTTYDGISSDDTYLFRSKLRQVTPAELQEGEAFIDEFFQKYDAYLPDADQMPWFDYDTKLIESQLGPAAFAGVHAVDVSVP